MPRSARLRLLLLLALPALAHRPCEAELSFAAPFVIEAAPSIRNVELADFDADGQLDLAFCDTHAEEPAVRVWFGTAPGRFERRMSHKVPGIFGRLAKADLDGDGRLDLIAACSGRVVVLRGSAGGTFLPPVEYAVGGIPWSIVCSDVDGNGRVDVVTADDASGLSILLGNGDGTLALAHHIAIEGRARGLAAGDLDLDGRMDLATVGFGPVSVLFGREGGFEPPMLVQAGLSTLGVTIHDVDEDGIPDLIAANTGGDNVSIFNGRTDRTFGAPILLTCARGPNHVTIGDIDDDGHVDLVASCSTDHLMSVYRGAGDGSFSDRKDYLAGYAPNASEIVDLDGDGHRDIVTAHFSGGTVSILKGLGGGHFVDVRRVPTGDFATRVVALDLDGDAQLDLLAANPLENRLSVHRGLSGGGFGPMTLLPTAGSARDVAAGDLDGDQRPEVVAVGAYPDVVSVFARTLDGGFEARTDHAADQSPASVLIADVNGDGKSDVLVANAHESTCDCGCYTPSTVSVFLGSGDGTLGARNDFETGYLASHLAAADLDGDGDLDLVLAGRGEEACSHGFEVVGGWIVLLEGRGDGTFEAFRQLEPGGGPIALDDLDGDGHVDVVALRSFSSIAVLDGRGDGTFDAGREFHAGMDPQALVTADMDGDGILDVVSGNYRWRAVAVLRGTSAGDLAPPIAFGTAGHPLDLAVGDFDRDGCPDIVTAGFAEDALTLLMNDTPNHPTPVAVSLARAELTSGLVRLGWHAGEGTVSHATVYRRVQDGPLIDVGPARITVDRLEFEEPAPGYGFFGYRLGYREAGGGAEQFTPEEWIEIPRAPRLAIECVNPVGSWPGARIAVTRSPDVSSRLELIDLSGRRLWSHEIAPSESPRRDLVPTQELPPAGVYLLRLSQSGKAIARKLVVTR